MTGKDDKPPSDREADEKHPPSSELLRIIEDYANELRRIIQELRKRLH